MTRDQLRALVTRADLLEAECRVRQAEGVTWAGRARALRDYGRSGGSAMDRRLLVEAMAELEREAKA